MTGPPSAPACVICGHDGSLMVDPPRRTVARCGNPSEPSVSRIAVLPYVLLCEDHAEEVAHRQFRLGWCDDLRCRRYGESGEASPCGAPYKELKH